MKLRFSKKRNKAFTLAEVLVILAIVALMAFMVYPGDITPREKERAQRIYCVSNLKQVSLVLRIWAGDHNHQYPMAVSVTNGGAMECVAVNNVAACFQVMSNELSTPRILICPADVDHFPATNFQNDFNNSHISYFLNPDVNESYPQMIMSGDDNLTTNGVPVQPGVLELSANVSLGWTSARHYHFGNLSFADGSVSEESSQGFQNAFELSTNGTPFLASRLVIP